MVALAATCDNAGRLGLLGVGGYVSLWETFPSPIPGRSRNRHAVLSGIQSRPTRLSSSARPCLRRRSASTGLQNLQSSFAIRHQPAARIGEATQGGTTIESGQNTAFFAVCRCRRRPVRTFRDRIGTRRALSVRRRRASCSPADNRPTDSPAAAGSITFIVSNLHVVKRCGTCRRGLATLARHGNLHVFTPPGRVACSCTASPAVSLPPRLGRRRRAAT